jgi:diadenosine tetraphosphatase ApaH/serine/threonine PP2A family protein phosphatase
MEKGREGPVRIALFSDIHANREAFEACLADAEHRGFDRIGLLGDIVGYGADPSWAVDVCARLVEDGAFALLGNHDQAVFASEEDMNSRAREAIRWTRTRLDHAQTEWLRSLPFLLREGEILFVHANAWAPESWGYVTGSREAERSMRRTDARITFCGHTHVPAVHHMAPARPAAPFVPVPDRAIPFLTSRSWLAVIGSVGQPRDGIAAACYALYDTTTRELTYRRVAYDVDAAAEKILRAGLPSSLADRLHRGG